MDELRNWYMAHLLGQYPRKDINPFDLPKQLFERYGINPDEFYFKGREGLMTHHFLMMKQWFNKFKPKTILDLGCGYGHYGFVANEFLGCEYLGIDKSQWVVDNKRYNLDIRQGKIPSSLFLPDSDYDLVLCADILEHIPEDEIDMAIEIISGLGKNFIFSIPFEGDPNLENDKTHLVKKSKEWWVSKLSEYFRIEDAPKDWLFNWQILTGVKK
jgi:SAM-dependent methyltransferase